MIKKKFKKKFKHMISFNIWYFISKLQENLRVKAMKQKENLLQNMEQDLRIEIRWREKKTT